MKNFIPLILVLIFSLSLFSQSENTDSLVKPRKTRAITIEEVYTIDSTHLIGESPLLEAFKGIGIEPVKEAYKLNRLAVDSVLAADSLNPNFWRVYGYQAVYLFVQANKSTSMAMSIFLPWFLILFVLVIVILSIKTFLVRPWLMDAAKPKNDPNASIEEPEEEDQPTDEDEADEPPKDEGEEAGQIH